jgi:hypothetical protein
VIKFLLEEIEKSPNPLFCKRELLYLSEEEFKILTDKKILVYSRSPGDETEKLRFPRCQYGCALTIVQTEGAYEAACLEHPEEAPVPLERDDLSRYKVSIDKLMFEIRNANRIDGDLHRINGGHFYVGYKTYNDNRIGIIFVPNFDNTDVINLSGLKYLCKDDDVLLVLTPVSNINDVILKKQLASEKIVQMSIAAWLNPQNFELPILECVSPLLKLGDNALAELSAKQKKDYEKFEYMCYDKIHIPGTTPMRRSNLIVVNGKDVRIGDSLFKLFLRFVVESKKNSGGWVDRYTLGSERFVSDPDSFQVYSNLRAKIEGSLLDRKGEWFLQSDGSKNYRISTHPDFITYDKKKLQDHQSGIVKSIAKKLPA